MSSTAHPGWNAKRSPLLWGLPLLVALASIAVVLWSSVTYGLSVEPDSVVYLGAAGSLLAGHGLSYQGQPLTHFPPAYPTVLAAASRLLGAAPFAAARYVQALQLGISVFLVAFVAYQSSAGSVSVVATATLLFSLWTQAVDSHLKVASEPLFLALTLTCFGFLALYLRQSRLRWLAAAALAAGLAVTTRYVGVALIPILLWAVWRYGQRRQRYGSTGAVLLCSGGPVAAWMVRNLSLGQKATNRTLAYHPIEIGRWHELRQATVEMALPELELPGPLPILVAVGIVMVAALAIGLWLMAERRHPDPARPAARLNRMVLAFAACYFLVLALSLTFFDASTNVRGRIVLIPFTALGLAALSSAHELTRGRRAALWLGLLLCLLPFALRNAQVSYRMTREMRATGHGYSSLAWASSPILSAAKALRPELVLYTNASDAIEFVAGRDSAYLPRLYEPTSLVVNADYARELELVCGQCQEGNAVVVYLYGIPGRWHYGTREELLSLCPLEYLSEWSDGAILGVRQ